MLSDCLTGCPYDGREWQAAPERAGAIVEGVPFCRNGSMPDSSFHALVAGRERGQSLELPQVCGCCQGVSGTRLPFGLLGKALQNESLSCSKNEPLCSAPLQGVQHRSLAYNQQHTWRYEAKVSRHSMVSCVSLGYRGVVAAVGRNVLDEAGANLVRGTIQAVANGIASCQGEVLGLTRDVLVVQPPVQGTREVQLSLQCPDTPQKVLEGTSISEPAKMA